jgi:hypothetical protein
MGRPRNPPTEPEEILLEQHGFGDLPEVFAMRADDNSIIQEHEPCYECTADGFYGKGIDGTYYPEGSIIVTSETPNDYMKPLNKASGLRFVQWMQSLPQNRAQIDIGDMSEAAQMLAKDPNVTALAPLEYQKALIKLCEELKIRRNGGVAPQAPHIQHNFTPQSGGNAPPILGAKVADLSQRAPGSTNAKTTIPHGHVQSARLAALGGMPPR